MKILQISAGRERSVALAETGSAYGWGAFKKVLPRVPDEIAGAICSTDATEIGHNRFAQPVPQILNPHQPFAAIADGYIDTLGIHRAGSVLSCRPLIAPQAGAAQLPISGMPSTAVQAALTESAAFALHADGSVWSWGMNVNGQLGRISPLLRSEAAAIAELPPVAALAAGHGHMLALDRNGQVWAWGANTAGQLGSGTLEAVPRSPPLRCAARG